MDKRKTEYGETPPSNVSRHIYSQRVCNSISDMCNFSGLGSVLPVRLFRCFKLGTVLNFDHRVMNFLLGPKGAEGKQFWNNIHRIVMFQRFQ